MAKQTKTQETIVKENLTEKKVSTVEKIETVMEENIKENNIVEEVKEDNTIEDTPEIKESIIEKETSNKVKQVIQKRPSQFNLLMEDGRRLLVHKSLFDKDNMIVREE